MKVPYYAWWVLAWTALSASTLTFISGIFSFPIHWRQGVGLLLIGIGIAVPALWWLRYSGRRTRTQRMPTFSVVGAVAVVGGFSILPWSSLATEDDRREANRMPNEVVDSSPAMPLPSSSVASSSVAFPSPTTTMTSPGPERSVFVLPESEVQTTIYVESTVTVTQFETVIPTTVTRTLQIPSVSAPLQTFSPELEAPQTSLGTPAPVEPQPIQTSEEAAEEGDVAPGDAETQQSAPPFQ
ncbi:hypothetical protein [Corynebacterium sp. A21]|uniref:hypothetical protein n=1 Tax=Corynebacterium sp. A21 TaxID=3457318 RepID=UPI003FD4642B